MPASRRAANNQKIFGRKNQPGMERSNYVEGLGFLLVLFDLISNKEKWDGGTSGFWGIGGNWWVGINCASSERPPPSPSW